MEQMYNSDILELVFSSSMSLVDKTAVYFVAKKL